MHFPFLLVTTGGGPKQPMGRTAQYPSSLFASGRAVSGVEVTRALETVVNWHFSIGKTKGHVRKAGIQVAVMLRKPLLAVKHTVEMPSCDCHIRIGQLSAGSGSFGDI
jgi:hypothetical protein